MSSPLPVVFASDDTFALPLGVAVYSLLENAHPDTQLHIFILDDGISDRNAERLKRVIDRSRPQTPVTWIEVAATTSNRAALPTSTLRTSHRISETAYQRLLIPSLLPHSYSRAVYLDVDVTVECDLAPLRDHSFGGASTLAVRDYKIQTVSHSKGLARYQEFGLDPDTPYFNSGVLVMDLDEWRRKDVRTQALQYVARHHDVMNACDQEALNAVLVDDWNELDPRWNRQTDFWRRETWPPSSFADEVKAKQTALESAPYIDHFTGSTKPWSILGTSRSTTRFMQYLKRSGWFTPLGYQTWQTIRTARTPEYYMRNLTRSWRRYFRQVSQI